MTRLNQRRNIWWYQGKAMVDGVLVAEAEISAMIMLEPPVEKQV
jgi:3-hydroxyacyl-[acyl-carrier-protein] dehydratase